MADTLNFGPEWLRALSDGNSVASPPPTPGLGGKFKLANNRYGREEMLALFHDQYKAPDELKEIPSIYCETIQKPLAFISLSEEEQRLMSQSVNSVTVLRSMGRGSGPPTRGRGGSNAERGRGRGRGRGDSYINRVLSENGDSNINSGGFGVPGRNTNNDGWEEVGKKYDRNYISRNYDDNSASGTRREFTRSLSNDNWREKNEEDGSWRRAGPRDKWNTRGSWRDPNHDLKEVDKSNGFSRDGPPGHAYQRNRNIESWDTEDNLPEWSIDADDNEILGSFDATGAFVSTSKEPGGLEEENDLKSSPDKENSKPIDGKERENNNNNKEQEELLKKSSNSAIKNDNNPKTINNNSSPPGTGKDMSQISVSGQNTVSRTSPLNIKQSESIDISNTQQHNKAKLATKKPPQINRPTNMKQRDGEALDLMKLEVENLVAKVTDEADEYIQPTTEQTIPAAQSENAFKWLYKDPQGDVQGPFTSDEMAEWFSAGYFTMSLLVKRGCDERFQQLGDLIKRWGRVPFLAGIAPPPLLNSPVTSLPADPAIIAPQPLPTPAGLSSDQMNNILKQQYKLQQDLLFMRTQQQQQQQHHHQQQQHQQQQQQLQQQLLMQQLYEQDGFKQQQQQLMMQMMMNQPMLLQQLQQQQQLQQPTPPQHPTPPLQPTQPHPHRLSPLLTEQNILPNHPSFHRSMSQPSPADIPGDETIWGGVSSSGPPPSLGSGAYSKATNVWDLEAGKPSVPAELCAQIQRMHQEMERLKGLEEERKREEELKQLEIQRKEEEIKHQQELLMREKQEIERQRLLELQLEEAKNQEDMRRQAEELRKQEEERSRHLQIQEEQRRQEEERLRLEENRRMMEERGKEEERRKLAKQIEEERKRLEKRQKEEAKRKMEEEKRRQQEILQQQEMIRQEELKQQREIEERKKQEEAEKQAELQRQQQEALRKLQLQQREQLSNIKLPATAQWANQQNNGNNTNSLSLTQIQQQEHKKWMEEEQQRQIEQQQKQQMEMLQQKQNQHQQQQQQQQQKSWANYAQSPASNRKSLMQIQQEEQAKLLDTDRKRQQTQPKPAPQQTKNVSLASAAAWAGQSTNNNSVWKGESGAAGGIWEQPPSSKKKAATAVGAEFPVLKNKKSTASTTKTTNKTTNGKTTKEEAVVKNLFQPQQKSDEFTTWCENALRNIATSVVDVPTFIVFLQDVESPYEVHDYVRSYLGETKAVNDFSRQYLEKRSQYKNKKRQEKKQQEDSIWGPAPAITPKEKKPAAASDGNAQKSKGKKKKKMQKLVGVELGFTCHAAPDRVNAGEIENIQ